MCIDVIVLAKVYDKPVGAIRRRVHGGSTRVPRFSKSKKLVAKNNDYHISQPQGFCRFARTDFSNAPYSSRIIVCATRLFTDECR